ncbi:MAG: nucleotidyltransferase domain-containing protein [Candidatus Hydrogenedentes bacterium]|nr:nucleotidyltransferase domain-containing protein [Candidatus Hydrogenedentota bacterium]
MVDPTIADSVKRYLLRLREEGLAVSFGVIFGSFATGTPHQWSDIDLMVVSPRFDGPVARDDINRLWRTAARTDNRIEPVACGERQWVEDTSRAIVEIARRGGTRIAP